MSFGPVDADDEDHHPEELRERQGLEEEDIGVDGCGHGLEQGEQRPELQRHEVHGVRHEGLPEYLRGQRQDDEQQPALCGTRKQVLPTQYRHRKTHRSAPQTE